MKDLIYLLFGLLKEEKNKIGQGWLTKLETVPEKISGENPNYLLAELTEKLYGTKAYEIPTKDHFELIDKSEKGMEKAIVFLQKNNISQVLTYGKAKEIFLNLKRPYSKEFATFFIRNIKEFISNSNYYSKVQNMNERFDELMCDQQTRARFLSGELTIYEVLRDTEYKVYDEIKDGEWDLEYRARKSGITTNEFFVMKRYFEKMKKRGYQTIPPEEATIGNIRGRMLRIDDPLHFTVGNIINCCQIFNYIGEGSVLHSASEHNGGIFVIEELDQFGEVKEILAQSWVWRNRNRVCFDNIEAIENVANCLEIFEVYKSVAQKMIQTDEKLLSKLLSSGKITQEEYDYFVLSEVTVGTGNDKIIAHLPEKIKKSLEMAQSLVPLEVNKEYIGTKGHKKYVMLDSHYSQRILAKSEKAQTSDKPVSSKTINKDIPSKYGKIREVIKRVGMEINPDLIRAMVQMNEKAGNLDNLFVKSNSTSIFDIINTFDSNFLLREFKLAISENCDWYMFTKEDENSITILDSLIVANDNSSKTNMKMALIEYQKEFYRLIRNSYLKKKPLFINPEREGKFINLNSDVNLELERNLVVAKDLEEIDNRISSLDKLLENKREEKILNFPENSKKFKDEELEISQY